MALVNKLINPTPFDVKIPYERGIELKIPADGELELTIEQMDDYRPGKPGSEEVKKLLNYNGLFLMDVDRSYDSQALQAIEVSITEKKKRVDDFFNALKANRSKNGYDLDEKILQEIANNAGYGSPGIGAELGLLQRRASTLRKVVQADQSQGKVKERLDPERTCYVTKPPRQFPSKIAMAMYLEDHPDIKKQHEEWVRAAGNKVND